MSTNDTTGCKDCGAPCRGARCRDCTIERRHADVEYGGDWYDCPECGKPTSGREVTCYRCRKADE